MSDRKVLLTESSLEDIADAIREKTGGSDTYTPAAMAAGIRSIEGGVTPSENLAGNLAVAYRDLAFPVAAGTHCVYGGNYYIAAVEIEYAETFNAEHWTRITAGEEIEDLTAAVGDLDEALEGKQPVEPGKGLSSNDYTDADKAALEAMAAALSGAQVRQRHVGASISVPDTVAEEIAIFTLYGKSVQSGTPAPDSPAAISSAGDADSIGITDNGETVTLPTPGGLSGIPVTSGGNYVDSNGQRWICDTIDKHSGVYIKRVNHIQIPSDNIIFSGGNMVYQIAATPVVDTAYVGQLSNRFHFVRSVSLVTNTYGAFKVHVAPSNNGTYVYMHAPDGVTDAITAAAWLADNPVTVVYPLADPVVTDLTAAQLAALDALRAADGTTTLATTDALQPEMAAAMYVQLPEYTV